jgi:hypothetical protein
MRYGLQILVLRLSALILTSAISIAQDAGSPTAIAVISGTVIDAVTRQPLGSAQVRVRNLSPGQGFTHFGSASSDVEGHFVIDSLSEGCYFLFASHPGYVGQHISGAGSGRSIAVAPDQHINDLHSCR